MDLYSTEQSDPPVPTKKVAVKLRDSPSCHESPTNYRRNSSPEPKRRRPHKQKSFDRQTYDDTDAQIDRIAELEGIIQELDRFDTKPLKDELSMSKGIFSLAVKEINSCSPERFEQIRQKVVRTSRFKSLEFKKDVLTKKGVLKILGKKEEKK